MKTDPRIGLSLVLEWIAYTSLAALHFVNGEAVVPHAGQNDTFVPSQSSGKRDGNGLRRPRKTIGPAPGTLRCSARLMLAEGGTWRAEHRKVPGAGELVCVIPHRVEYTLFYGLLVIAVSLRIYRQFRRKRKNRSDSHDSLMD